MFKQIVILLFILIIGVTAGYVINLALDFKIPNLSFRNKRQFGPGGFGRGGAPYSPSYRPSFGRNDRGFDNGFNRGGGFGHRHGSPSVIKKTVVTEVIRGK